MYMNKIVPGSSFAQSSDATAPTEVGASGKPDHTLGNVWVGGKLSEEQALHAWTRFATNRKDSVYVMVTDNIPQLRRSFDEIEGSFRHIHYVDESGVLQENKLNVMGVKQVFNLSRQAETKTAEAGHMVIVRKVGKRVISFRHIQLIRLLWRLCMPSLQGL